MWLLQKSLLISGIIMSSLLINKMYTLSNKTEEITNFHLPENLQRESIFDQQNIITDKLKEIFDYENFEGKIEKKIVNEKLDEHLREFIKIEIKKIFEKRGWNFQELEGRIYYEVNKSSIEIYVLWKNNIYDKNFSYYDRFEIVFA